MSRTIELRYSTYDETSPRLVESQLKSVSYEFEITEETEMDTLYAHFERFCEAIGYSV